MMPLRFSPAARLDLEGIWDYTVEHWSIGQADRYLQDIREACEALATGRRSGRSVARARSGYFKFAVGSHFVVYRKDGGTTIVVRILHQAHGYRSPVV
ncbi:MAG: type II toxin-antitoxin system RelE/ParE family toxin [Rhizobiaceae bacterium]